MAQIHDNLTLSTIVASRIGRLADIPFQPDSLALVCAMNDWVVIPPEEWATGSAPFLQIQVDDAEQPMIAIWGDECAAGLPLSVVFIDDVSEDILPATWALFDSRFLAAKTKCEAVFGVPSKAGRYESKLHSHWFHFAFFQRQNSTIALLQHHEGDGHLGNDASLDIRIIPCTADKISLPLSTNLLF